MPRSRYGRAKIGEAEGRLLSITKRVHVVLVTLVIVAAVTLAGAVGNADTGKAVTVLMFLIGGVAEAMERHRAGGEQQTVGVVIAKLAISPVVGLGYAWGLGMGLGAFLGAPAQ